MKVECVKENIKNKIAQAERVTGKNLSLPILSSVLLETGDGKLLIKATNLDLGIELDLPARVERSGRVAVSGSLMNNFLANLGGEETVKFESVGENLSASTSKNSTLIKSYSTTDFPAIPKVKADKTFMIPAGVLRDGIRSVCYAASMSDIKPEISSVYVYSKDGEIYFVATDSFRLAEKSARAAGVEAGVSLLVPYKNAMEILRILDGVVEDVEVGFNKNQIVVSSENIYLTSRLTGGVFPNYSQIIPKEKKTEAVVLKKDIINSLKLTNIFSDKLNKVTLRVFPKDGLFEIESSNTDTGENTTQVDGALEGEDIQLPFNGRYILESFQSIPEDSVAISLCGPGRPLVVRGVGGSSFVYLVMPLNS